MGTTLIIGNAIVGSSGIPLVAPLAIISNTLASEILDTGFKVETDVLPNGVDTTVFLHWGLTSAMTETPIEFTESPVLGTEIVPVTLDYVLTGLLPYRRYFFQIEAINLNGTVLSSIYNEITLEPLELTDGNWVAQYEGDYEKNVPYSVNASYIAELRDKRFDCALGIECNPQPSFDAAAGIGLATGITISGGNLIFTNVAHGVNAYFQIPAPERVNGAYRVEMPGVSGRSGVIYNVSSGQVLAAGVAEANIPNGDYAKDVCFNNNGYFYWRGQLGNSNGIFAGTSVKRILGNHAWGNVTTGFPFKNGNQLEFDGSNDRLQAQSLTTIGTVYAYVRRVGTDAELGMRNDLTGIGQFTSPVLSIGSNVAANTFYNIHLRKLWVRSVTDSAPVIAKLNEWLLRDNYDAPPPIGEGIVATGRLNDNALFKDSALWNDGV